MFVIIFITSLITVVVLIITSASYLISLICDESDDNNSSESLAIDFANTFSDWSDRPSSSVVCINPKHHHHYDEFKSINIAHGQAPIAPSPDTHLGALNASRSSLTASSLATQSPESLSLGPTIDYTTEPHTNDLEDSSWSGSAKEQKTIITSQIGAPASKSLFDDFDAREMQLGGTGLHWCKSRKSLDKLIRLGLPLNARNNRQETAVHVAIRRRKLQVLIGLLVHGASVECRNENGETPILVACKLVDIFACQLLLVYDAEVNAEDKSGFSSRHYIATICEKNRAQPQMPNPAHVILAMLDEMGARRCIDQASDQVSNKSPTKSGNHQVTSCADGCSTGGTYNGNSYNRWPNYQKESLYKRHMFTDIIEHQRRLNRLRVSSINRRKRRASVMSSCEDTQAIERSRLLCIDGGGMRGVIVCQILIELEKFLKKPVISYFDWVGGTSVGAFLSCALCRGTPLKELRKISFDVKDEVFSGNRPYNSKFLERVLKRTYGPSTRMSDVTDRKLAVTTVLADRDPCQLRLFRNYKSTAQLLKQYGYSTDTYDCLSGHSVMSKRRSSGIAGEKKQNKPQVESDANKENVNAAKKETKKRIETVNYSAIDETIKRESSSGLNKGVTVGITDDNTDDSKTDGLSDNVIDENEQDPLMWQAVRASAAAPFFFKPYGPYLDGGIISNNPTMDMLTEFHSHERVKSFLRARANKKSDLGSQNENIHLFEDPPKSLGLVLSLGTGRGRVIGRQAMLDFGQVASGFATVFSPVELLRSIKAARDLFKKVMQQSCQTEDHILDRAQAWCSSIGIPYFRINPPLATLFSIDDKRDEQLINALWQAKLYMRAMRPQLEELGWLLDGESNQDELSSRNSSASENIYGNYSDLENSCDENNNESIASCTCSDVSIRDTWSQSTTDS